MAEDTDQRLVNVFKALADPSRLRILGALAERPRTGNELAETLAVGPPTISHHMARLTTAHLVTVERDGQRHIYRLNEGALRDLIPLATARTPATAETVDTGDPVERDRAKVIRDFFDGPRLKQIPAQRKKRVIVLQHVLGRFDPRREFLEREVNDLLREAHEDVATLRRELVDYGFMTRAGGVYRVARALPQRSVQVAQEIPGDEHTWLHRLLTECPT
ncbi:MAG: metalloregulator ArsR/SmtB family transcription factor [Thermomicrobiales bacterium]